MTDQSMHPPVRSAASDRRRRMELGLSLDDFAIEAGISPNQLHDYESTAPGGRVDANVVLCVGEALDRLERAGASKTTPAEER
jgi:transcriptional regulator with XRE-family HTH domain